MPAERVDGRRGAPVSWPQRLARALCPLDCPPPDPSPRADLEDLIGPGQSPRLAAVLVPIRLLGGAPRLLLTRRAEGLAQHSGQISFPGGAIEASDAGPVAAALREAREEIGLPESLVEPLGFLAPLLTISGYRVQPVVALIVGDFDPVLDEREVAEVFDVPLPFLLEAGNVRKDSAEFRGRVRHWHEYHYGQRHIWGVTAEIILDLRTVLQGEGS